MPQHPAPPSIAHLRIAVIEGGPSTEAEVSHVSAAAVAGALRERGAQVVRCECDATLPARLADRPDVVFPVAHGQLGEDGCLQGLLEMLALPYVGADVLGSAIANDKRAAKAMFRSAGLPTASAVEVLASTPCSVSAWAEHAVSELGRAVVVKPARQGSAIGVSVLPELEGPADPRLLKAIEWALSIDDAVLIERFLRGREITCGVFDEGPGKVLALPPTEVRVDRTFYDFEARYRAKASTHLCPAPLDPQSTARVQALALQAHQAVRARDLSRTDFVVSDSEIIVLEVNTIPGMTATSLYPEAAGIAGIPFGDLCARLVLTAIGRGARRAGTPWQFPG